MTHQTATDFPSELEPIDNHILFQFDDELDKDRRNTFKEATDWGFVIRGSIQETTRLGRWGRIVALGPEAVEDGFDVNQRILIAPLAWTRVVEYKGITFARTDSNQILAVDERKS